MQHQHEATVKTIHDVIVKTEPTQLEASILHEVVAWTEIPLVHAITQHPDKATDAEVVEAYAMDRDWSKERLRVCRCGHPGSVCHRANNRYA